jgi:hypothetical protein
LYAGLDVMAGVKIDVLGKTIADYQATVIDYSVLLAQSPVQPPCYPLTISHTGIGSDPVAIPSYSTGCSPGQYLSGEFIQLSGAIPAPGWQIDRWTNTNNDSSKSSSNSLIMPGYPLSVNVNYTEIPLSSSVTVDQVYTTDFLSNPKTSFRPGEAIVFHLIATNHESYNIDVSYDWDIYDPNGGYVSYLSYPGWQVNVPTGEDYWFLERGLASSTYIGEYTYTASASFSSGTYSDSTNFVVQGSPISINMIDALTCRGVENQFPVGPTDTFTSGDDDIYVWIALEGASGYHTVSYLWYRPDHTLHLDFPDSFDVSDSLLLTWASIPTSGMGSYTGEWYVYIYIDSVYETTLYFTYEG